MKEQLLQIFQDAAGYMSSKRVFGGIGFVIGLVMCFFKVDIAVISLVLGTSAAMLGLDSVTDIWKQTK